MANSRADQKAEGGQVLAPPAAGANSNRTGARSGSREAGQAFRAPLRLPNGQVLANRLAKAAMTEGLADPAGRPTPELIRLYGLWAQGGVGLLITGNSAVDRFHLERAGNVVIDGPPNRALRKGLADLATAAKSGGSRVWAQLSHAGRQTPRALNANPEAASDVPLRKMPLMSFGTPVALSSGGIQRVTSRFVQAARTLEDAGFDGVQVHAAHGYPLSAFLSPLANDRSDQWGGSLEARAALLVDIVRRIRSSVSASFAVSVKLNSADFQRGGFDVGDSAAVASWLDAEGVDLIEISGGNYEAPAMMGSVPEERLPLGRTAAREAYFLEFAPRIRASVRRSALMITGGFRSADLMDQALTLNVTDMIGLGRPLLVDPGAGLALLNGSPSLRRVEDELGLGPGWLSPRSSSAGIRALNASLSQAWCYEQMDRLGAGGRADEDRGMLRASAAYLVRNRRKERACRFAFRR